MFRDILMVLIGFTLLVGCSPKIDQKKYENLHRTAKAIEGATAVGVSYQKFEELLQNLSTDISIANDKDKSDSDIRMREASRGRFGKRAGGNGARRPKVSSASTKSASRAPALAVESSPSAPSTSCSPGEPDVRTLIEFVDQILRGEFVAQWEAEKIKENALALKHILDGQKKAGELVSIEIAKNILFETSRAARDAWLNFPSKAGPVMAAELGVEEDRLVEILTPHVYRQLSDIAEGETDVDFAEPES